MYLHFKAYISRINNMYSLLFLDIYFLRNRGRTVDNSASKSDIQYVISLKVKGKTVDYSLQISNII